MINKFIGIGNLGADPESRFTGDGTAVTTFRIACSERWKDKAGQMQESTEWVSIVTWRGLAEVCSQYLAKGSKVYVEGKLKTRKWQDKDGNDRYTTEVIASEMKMLDGKGGGEQRGPGPAEVGDIDDSIPF